MGEVGAVIPDKQSESPTVVNGDMNGVCKTNEHIEVDTEEDSQISSENGISDVSQDNTSNKPLIISKAESISTTESVVTKESSVEPPSIHSENSREIISEEILQNNSNSSNISSAVKENGVGAPDTEQTQSISGDTSDSQSSITNKPIPEQKTKENGEMNGGGAGGDGGDVSFKKTAPPIITDEIQIIESDDDEDEVPNNESSNQSQLTLGLPSSTGLVISSVEGNVEQKEFETSTNGSAQMKRSIAEPMDEDGAVIIQSDSENEYDDGKGSTEEKIDQPQQKTESAKPNQPVEDDLSDKDDCVVIEDDDKKEKEEASPRRTNRQRKSVVKARDFDDDDDIAEILDDAPSGQPPSKRARTTNSPMGPAIMPQIGQITIKDPRSLMGPFIDGTQKSFQQQFVQSAGNKGTKEPTLVIIDTSSIPQPGTPQTNVQNVPKQNSPFSVLPVGVPAQGVFPVNVRPTLAPLSTPPKLVPTTAVQPPALAVANSNLLPALTDDMYVLEAPSFIVPYIYEKPPPESLKQILTKIEVELEKTKKEIKKSDGAATNDEGKDDSKTVEAKSDGGAEQKTNEGTKSSSSKKKKKGKNPDDSWDESDTSTDEEASDSEVRTKVLIKEAKEDLDTIKAHIITPETAKEVASVQDDKKTENYFESPLGKFFIDIGISLVQEHVQADLLRQQKRKRDRAGTSTSEVEKIEVAINALKKNLDTSRKRNEPFKFDMKRCEYCNFKSESALSMAHHYETPHMRNYMYKCNFCTFETRPPHDILFHMEAVHNIKGRLEKAPSIHQCPNCPFEDNGKSKIARHAPVCVKKFRPEGNLLPPHDWEAPAKIPRIKPRHGLVGTATAYQAMAAQQAAQKAQLAQMTARGVSPNANSALLRNRGRPQTVTRVSPGAGGTVLRNNQQLRQQIPGMVLPNSYQIAGGQLIQPQNTKKSSGQQPSISITPLPRQPANLSNSPSIPAAIAPVNKPPGGLKPGQSPTGGKASFVICEICDGYIKDLEQLRNHMQWMHKVKIHPKMIYNRPPLNCQKCQFRFFTDQGLERHLLGSHGLVTSSMQEAANKGRDAGRCPVCGKMYQWKLLNHVSRDHHMTLKPAHLSYKCTVCTATFGMYKQFENHVYTAHSTVAKKAMDGKKSSNNSSSSSNSNNPMPSGSNSSGSSQKSTSLSSLGGDSLLKPLRINDEITIIPQPATKSRGSTIDYESHVIGKLSNKR